MKHLSGYMFCTKHLPNFTRSPPFLYWVATPAMYAFVDLDSDPAIAYLLIRDEVGYRLSGVSAASICI